MRVKLALVSDEMGDPYFQMVRLNPAMRQWIAFGMSLDAAVASRMLGWAMIRDLMVTEVRRCIPGH